MRDSAVTNTSHVEITVMDDVVHISRNGESKTFAEYAEVVIPHVFLELGKPNAWISSGIHVYMKDSLKLSTRANRGSGTRKRVSSHAKLPGSWKNKLLTK